MDMRKLGHSGLETPRLVLGGNVFGWTAKGEEAFAILDRFAEAGGVMIWQLLGDAAGDLSLLNVINKTIVENKRVRK